MKYFLYIILILMTIIPLFSEILFGKNGRIEFFKFLKAELSATSNKNKENSIDSEKKIYNLSRKNSGMKIMEEDFDDQENSDDEQENEEIEEET